MHVRLVWGSASFIWSFSLWTTYLKRILGVIVIEQLQLLLPAVAGLCSRRLFFTCSFFFMPAVQKKNIASYVTCISWRNICLVSGLFVNSEALMYQNKIQTSSY